MFNEFNALNDDDRISLLKHIRSKDTINRKRESFKQHDIYKNKLEKYVRDSLISYTSAETVKQMAVVSDVGICKQIINNEASIYLDKPKRSFTGTKKKTLIKNIGDLYETMNIDEINKKQNRFLKLQKQNVSYIIANSDNELEKKVLKLHEFDVIPNNLNPAKPFGYVISPFNQPQKDEDQRYVIWTKDHNFTMNGKGSIIESKEIDKLNPIAPMLPFNELSYDKDGNFFTDEIELSVSFGVRLNAAFSELYHIMRMQGFGQAVMTGSKKGIPTASELEVGLNKVIVLLTEEGESADFKFVNASPDLAGAIDVIATLLSAFLTAKGVDPKKLSIRGDSPQAFASGFERFLALIEEFKATLDDHALMKKAERRDFEIIKAWIDAYRSTDHLKDEYIIKEDLASIKLNVEFAKPHVVESKADKGNRLKSDVDNGQISKLQSIMEYHNLDSIEEAMEFYKKMKEHEKMVADFDKTIEQPPIENNDA